MVTLFSLGAGKVRSGGPALETLVLPRNGHYKHLCGNCVTGAYESQQAQGRLALVTILARKNKRKTAYIDRPLLMKTWSAEEVGASRVKGADAALGARRIASRLVRVMHPRAASGGHSTARATTAGAGAAGSPFGLGGAATGAAALGQQVGELMKLHGGRVGFGQFGRQGVDFGSRFAQNLHLSPTRSH